MKQIPKHILEQVEEIRKMRDNPLISGVMIFSGRQSRKTYIRNLLLTEDVEYEEVTKKLIEWKKK